MIAPSDTPEERAHYRRTHWKARKIRRGEDEDSFDREAIAAMTPEERIALSWQITKELFAFKGIDEAAIRLDRSTARLQRRRC